MVDTEWLLKSHRELLGVEKALQRRIKQLKMDDNENDVIDSGFAGVFAEYDAEHNLIASYTMDVEKFIYRVYKYSFDGYYFER